MFSIDFHHRLRSDGSKAEGVVIATTTLDDARNANGRTAEASARIVSQSVFERRRRRERASERSV